jgi:tRNA threonylcarbamoyladenosine biosynthesis protein TsaB
MADATYVNITPSARGLARLAQQRLDNGQTEDIAYFEPFYLKDFVVIPSKKRIL